MRIKSHNMLACVILNYHYVLSSKSTSTGVKKVFWIIHFCIVSNHLGLKLVTAIVSLFGFDLSNQVLLVFPLSLALRHKLTNILLHIALMSRDNSLYPQPL